MSMKINFMFPNAEEIENAPLMATGAYLRIRKTDYAFTGADSRF